MPPAEPSRLPYRTIRQADLAAESILTHVLAFSCVLRVWAPMASGAEVTCTMNRQPPKTDHPYVSLLTMAGLRNSGYSEDHFNRERPLVVKCTFYEKKRRITFNAAKNCSCDILRQKVGDSLPRA